MIETTQVNIWGKGNSKIEVLGAKLDREVQGRIGHPLSGELKQSVSQNPKTIPFCAVNVCNSKPIVGHSWPRIRETATRQMPDVVREGRLAIYRDFYIFHKIVTLCADMMFVGGLAFFEDTEFVTAGFVPKRTACKLAKSLRKVLKLYARGRFIVSICHMDQERIQLNNYVGTL